MQKPAAHFCGTGSLAQLFSVAIAPYLTGPVKRNSIYFCTGGKLASGGMGCAYGYPAFRRGLAFAFRAPFAGALAAGLEVDLPLSFTLARSALMMSITLLSRFAAFAIGSPLCFFCSRSCSAVS